MIIVRLNGGLGNQLFQYAAGFTLARMNDSELKLDLSTYTNSTGRRQTCRTPDILDFSLNTTIASLDECNRLRNPFGPFSAIARIVRQKGFKQYYEDWHPNVLRLRGDVYLDGYFQSERYFMDCFEYLRQDYQLKPEKASEVKLITNRIATMLNPVSLHVRRGDYVRHPEHEICTVAYFKSALSAMREAVGPFNLVVFSDEVQWVRNQLELGDDALYVSEYELADGNRFSPSQELVLMSHCHHHIISNSTFGWWGSYLNDRPEKVVMAPDIWNRSRLYPHNNILPAGWRRISVALL